MRYSKEQRVPSITTSEGAVNHRPPAGFLVLALALERKLFSGTIYVGFLVLALATWGVGYF